MCFMKSIVVVMFIFLMSSCASKKVTNVSFLSEKREIRGFTPKLNLFIPRQFKGTPAKVLIFIHGGNWNSGRKGTYDLLGRNFARKGILVVIPDYELSPITNYEGMARHVAAAIAWTKQNIASYHGNPNQVFITGHSAGGHLGALAVMNPKFGLDPKNISGIILNDAAGLDMKHYLQKYPPTNQDDYVATWTNDPKEWKKASPIYYINAQTPPVLLYVGTKTYPSIIEGTQRFEKTINVFQPEVQTISLNKKHVPMVMQYFNPWSPRFKEMIQFMEANSK